MLHIAQRCTYTCDRRAAEPDPHASHHTARQTGQHARRQAGATMSDRGRRPPQRPWPGLRVGRTLAAHSASALAWALTALGMALLYLVWPVMLVGAVLPMRP